MVLVRTSLLVAAASRSSLVDPQDLADGSFDGYPNFFVFIWGKDHSLSPGPAPDDAREQCPREVAQDLITDIGSFPAGHLNLN